MFMTCPHPLWPHLGGKSVLPSSKSSSARAGSGRFHSLTAKGDYRIPSSLGILGFSCYLWTSSSHFDFRPATWPNLSLVGGIPTPLKNMSSSVGIMTFPIYPIGSMYGIYGNIYHQYTPSHVSIYTSTMDPMGMEIHKSHVPNHQPVYIVIPIINHY